jgi:hypothetical protein
VVAQCAMMKKASSVAALNDFQNPPALAREPHFPAPESTVGQGPTRRAGDAASILAWQGSSGISDLLNCPALGRGDAGSAANRDDGPQRYAKVLPASSEAIHRPPYGHELNRHGDSRVAVIYWFSRISTGIVSATYPDRCRC